jgi:hypothetical protein
MKKKLLRWIVISQQPFTVVEEITFQEFIKTFYPEAKLPTANTIKNNIMECYENETKKIQEILQNISGQISYTIDIWTSVSMKAFLAITAHFIDEEWKLQTIVIDFIQIWGSHSGENIKEIFITCLKNFGIQTKVSYYLNYLS